MAEWCLGEVAESRVSEYSHSGEEERRETKTVSINCVNYKASDTEYL